MKVLASLLPVILIGGMLYLLIAALLDVVRLRGTSRVGWGCVVIFLFPIGPIIYMLANPGEHKTLLKYRTPIAVLTVVALVSLAIGIFPIFSPTLRLENITLSQVIQETNRGQINTIEVKGDELIITKQGENQPSQRSQKQPGSSLTQQGIDLTRVRIIIKND